MAEPTPAPAPPLPGMSTGSPPPAPVANGGPPATLGGLGSPAPVLQRPELFGGLRGGRPRKDGIKSGSPEAVEADRKKNAERMARNRERERLANPAALPSAAPGVAGAPAPPVGDLALPMPGAVAEWTAEDFREAAPELVELTEAWRVDTHTKHAVAGKLPRRIVEEIAKDAAFPPGSKRSLSSASPQTLAEMFNALSVPLSFKKIVTLAPALVYVIVRDLQVGGRVQKMIADENERQAVPAQEKKP